jgi:hypothetical protein
MYRLVKAWSQIGEDAIHSARGIYKPFFWCTDGTIDFEDNDADYVPIVSAREWIDQ